MKAKTFPEKLGQVFRKLLEQTLMGKKGNKHKESPAVVPLGVPVLWRHHGCPLPPGLLVSARSLEGRFARLWHNEMLQQRPTKTTGVARSTFVTDVSVRSQVSQVRAHRLLILVILNHVDHYQPLLLWKKQHSKQVFKVLTIILKYNLQYAAPTTAPKWKPILVGDLPLSSKALFLFLHATLSYWEQTAVRN